DLVIDRLLRVRALALLVVAAAGGGRGLAVRQVGRNRDRGGGGIAAGVRLVVGLGRAHDLSVRIVGLRTGRDAVEIHLSMDIDARLAGADRALKQLLDIACDAVLVIDAHLFGIGGSERRGGFAVAARQEIALIVDDRNAVRIEVWHRGSNEVLYRGN